MHNEKIDPAKPRIHPHLDDFRWRPLQPLSLLLLLLLLLCLLFWRLKKQLLPCLPRLSSLLHLLSWRLLLRLRLRLLRTVFLEKRQGVCCASGEGEDEGCLNNDVDWQCGDGNVFLDRVKPG